MPPSECLEPPFFSSHLDPPSLETLQCSQELCAQIPHPMLLGQDAQPKTLGSA